LSNQYTMLILASSLVLAHVQSPIDKPKHVQPEVRAGIERLEAILSAVGDQGPFTVSFTVPDGALLSIDAHELPPPVNPHPPVFSEADAMRAVRAYLNGKVHDVNRTDTLTGSNLLAYGTIDDSGIARLAWSIPFTCRHAFPSLLPHSGDTATARAQGGPNVIVLDAITGRVVKAVDGFGHPWQP